MNKLFLDYQLSLEMKEIGFDEPCFGWYSTTYLSLQIEGVDSTDMNGDVLAPLYQQCVDFFREKHGIHIDIDFALGWGYGFIPVGCELKLHNRFIEGKPQWTYYEALTQAIKKAINIVKKQTK